MSLVVAIKHKDRVVFGADKQVSTGNNKSHTTTKIWEVQDLPGAIMGGVGTLRASQIIQYNKIIDLNAIGPMGIDTEFIINNLAPNIIGCLEANGVKCSVKDDEDGIGTSIMMPNAFLFAFEDRAWMIWGDCGVSELEDYLAIGSGSDVANGALFATKDKNPFERIVTAIDAAAESTLYVDNGVDLLATKIYSQDHKQICKALGIEMPQVNKDITVPTVDELGFRDEIEREKKKFKETEVNNEENADVIEEEKTSKKTSKKVKNKE